MKAEKLKKKKNYVRLISVNLILLFIVLSYQACTQQYVVNLASTWPDKCNQGLCAVGEMSPSLVAERPPAKVLFVVDNSGSMALSQSNLSEGVKDLVADLKGFDADFHIYTTTDADVKKRDSNFSGALIDVVNDKPVRSSVTGKSCQWPKLDFMGSFKPSDVVASQMDLGPSCPLDEMKYPTTYIEESRYMMNADIAKVDDEVIRFRGADSEEKLDLTSEQLSQAILAVGVEGSTNETGLCTMVRSIYDESALRIFNKGDNAVMVVLSDEDDSSTPSSCLSRETLSKTYTGKTPVLQPCDPSIEKCDSVDYKISYNQVKIPHSELTAQFSCQVEKAAVLEPSSAERKKVIYSFKTAQTQLQYQCLQSKNYTVEFYPLNRKVSYSCYGGVNYQVQFANVDQYSQNLQYQCEQWDDGVKLGESSLLAINKFKSNVSPCSEGETLVCDQSAQDRASQECLSGGYRLKPDSCQLACHVDSLAVAPFSYTDSSSGATDRHLEERLDSSAQPLPADPVPNTNGLKLADYVKTLQAYSSNSYRVVGVTRGSVVSATTGNKDLVRNETECPSGQSLTIACADSALDPATIGGLCGAGKLLSSCQVICSGTASSTTATFADTVKDADLRNLSDDNAPVTIVTSTSSTDYVNGKAYLQAYYAKQAAHALKAIKSVSLPQTNLIYTPAQTPLLAENCQAETSDWLPCEAGSFADNESKRLCGVNRKPTSCSTKCVASAPRTIELNTDSQLAQETVNFCGGSDSVTAPDGSGGSSTPAASFTMSSNGSTYVSVADYAEQTIYPNAANGSSSANGIKARLISGSCTRQAYKWEPELRSESKAKNDWRACPHKADPSRVYSQADLNGLNFSLCSGTKGLTAGSNIDVSCKDREDKPTLEHNDTVFGPKVVMASQLKPQYDSNQQMINFCEAPISIGAQSYNSLRDWAKSIETARPDLPAQCEVLPLTFKKSVVPSGVQEDSSKRSAVSFTFPESVRADSAGSAHLESTFISKSEELFGKNGYFVSTIIRDQEADSISQCQKPLGADQKYGVKYKQLVEQVNSLSNTPKGEVTSICSSSYRQSLSSVSRWIKEVAARTHFAPEIKGPQDEIMIVWLYNPSSHTERGLLRNVDYEVAGNKINFINPAIDPKGLIIRYLYWKPKEESP